MKDVVAVGELLADMVEKGVSPEGSPVFEANPGGAPLNFLAALSRYGCGTAMIGCVGDDALGRMLVSALEKYGVDGSFVSVTGAAFTTMAFVTLGSRGEREFSFARKPGADTMIDLAKLPCEAIRGAKYLHFGTLSLTSEPARSATMAAVSLAKSSGVLVSFDPNYRAALWDSEDEARRRMIWGFGAADFIKAGADELEFALGVDFRSAARQLVRNGSSLVLATDGERGGFFCAAGTEGDYSAFRVEHTVDTTGAGDIFGGAALCRIIRSGKALRELGGRELREAVRFAGAAAALSSEKYGGAPSIPDERDVLTFLSSQPE